MARSRGDRLSSSSRRAILAGAGALMGTAIAGCSSYQAEDDDPQNRIQELEAELARTREENRALKGQIDELQSTLATTQRQLDDVNLWGFDQETMQRLQDLADTWSDSVVVIDVITDDGLWSVGTGWVYDDGVIATNAHVVNPRRLPDEYSIARYRIWTRNQSGVEGALLGYTYGRDEIFDSREDIGFLEVSSAITDGRKMDRGVSRELSKDEPLVQVGHPYSLEYWTPSVGPFIGHREPFFATNVPGQPGVSGAPVIDLAGDVVGMTWGGQYVRRPRRQVSDAPTPSDGDVLPAFEEAVDGMHSYMHRIQVAAEELV